MSDFKNILMQKFSQEFSLLCVALVFMGSVLTVGIKYDGENFLRNLAQVSGFSTPSTLVGSPKPTFFLDSGLTPATTYYYTIEAVDNAGRVSARSNPIAVTTLPSGGSAVSLPPTITLTAAPYFVSIGGSATISWVLMNAVQCAAGGAWSGTKATAGGSESTGSLTASKTYTLTCAGIGGSTSKSTTVTVGGTAGTPTPVPPPIPPPMPPPPPAPTASLVASAAEITSGGSVTLTWSSANVTSCAASGGWTGSKPTAGHQGSGTLTSNKTFTLTCTGAGGSVAQNVAVKVNPITGTPTPPPPPASPSASLTTSRATITSGESATLAWTSTNTTSCTATGGWSGTKSTTGNQSTGAMYATQIFSLICTGAGGSTAKNVTITVLSPTPAPAPPPYYETPIPYTPEPLPGSYYYPLTLNFTATPNRIARGESTNLNWVAEYSTDCQASGGWSGGLLNSGSIFSTNIQKTTDYGLTCSGPNGSISKSILVEVLNDSSEFGYSADNPDTLVSRKLSAGVIGEDVKKLQRFLISKKYLAGGNDTGNFGPATEQAVQNFQQSNSIVSGGTPQTTGFGSVGAVTLQKIQSEGWNIAATPRQNSIVEQNLTGRVTQNTISGSNNVTPPLTTNTDYPISPTRSVSTYNPCSGITGQITQNISYGSSGRNVTILQCKLIKLRYLGAGNASGFFGPKTLLAVKNLQCNQFITACKASAPGYGSVGPKTRTYLNLQK